MAESNDYNSNFFFPKSAFAKDNNALIAVCVIVWAIAVFGFHFWMKAIEKATPEAGHVTYMAAVDNLKSDVASIQQKQDVAKVYLTLTAKYMELREDKDGVIRKAFTLAVYDLLPDMEKQAFANAVKSDKVLEQNFDIVTRTLGLTKENYDPLLTNLIPYTVTTLDTTPTDYDKITPVMDKYLIHYRSFLTDTKFLGFPFHYFYSAVFLLVLFCGICWTYCILIDKVMKKHNMETDEG